MHVDQFPLVLNSCITLNGMSAGCTNSTTFRIIITNPCLTTTILNQPVPSVLTAPIEGSDSMSLLSSPTNWPWDEYFVTNGDSYYNYCRPYDAVVVYRGTDIPVSFI